MFEQPLDFQIESEALGELVASGGDGVFDVPTLFRRWTVNDVLTHLQVWNVGADLSLGDPDGFVEFYSRFSKTVAEGGPLRTLERDFVGNLRGPALLAAWREQVAAMTARFAAADPRQRVRWAGPDMSTRSSITARLMETWAHGQEVYDALGVERVDSDRIRNIAVLGVNTFDWSFTNRGLAMPRPTPHVRLVSPSGHVWAWNEASESDLVEGRATEFCQVVTQVRNIGDTSLRVCGPAAERWMAIAQCFAGTPQTPPEPGTRRRSVVS